MKNKKVVNRHRSTYKKWIVLFGVAGQLLGLVGCSKESEMEERNNSSEAMGAYFNGQKSVEEVVTIVQSRVNIYMNENR